MWISFGPYSLLSNSFQTKASKEYLIGDIYYSHPIQLGYPPAFEKNPLNNINGRNIRGPTMDAVSAWLKILEIKKPREEAEIAKRNRIA